MAEATKCSKYKLTLVGRLNTAKCYLTSQINYTGLLSELDDETLDTMDTIIWKFVKGNVNIARSTAFAKKESGGLGLKHTKDSLTAQKAQLWKLTKNPDDFWRKLCLEQGGGEKRWENI